MAVQAVTRGRRPFLSLRRGPGPGGADARPAGDDLEAVKTAFDVAVRRAASAATA